MQGEDFGRWKVFLHPTQRKLVERRYTGPARVGGGPGTGKTIVALHRVTHLAPQLPPGTDKPILLTTFNRNLAADLRTRLLALGGERTAVARRHRQHRQTRQRVIVREAEPGSRKQIIDDNQALDEWRALLDELGETRLGRRVPRRRVDAGHPRPGRRHPRRLLPGPPRRPRAGLTRPDASRDLAAHRTLHQRLDRPGAGPGARWPSAPPGWRWTRAAIQAIEQQREEAGGLDNIHLQDGSGGWLRYRYRHIVVDEAQDLRPAHWKMLRAMVAPGRTTCSSSATPTSASTTTR